MRAGFTYTPAHINETASLTHCGGSVQLMAEASPSVDREIIIMIMDSVPLINYNEFIKLNIIFVCASIMNAMLELFIANNYS